MKTSITKIMTCIIVLENSNIEEEIVVGDEVLSMYGTNIYISPGEKMTIKDLLYGLMLRSGNDAAETLAVQLFGNEEAFVQKMNAKAKELGMMDTTFSNPHGLDEESQNYSSAYDMVLLSRYAFRNEMYREIISTKKYNASSSLKSYVWYNRMNLLSAYSKCLGGKNGYTPSAGKTPVSYASNQDMVIIIVSLNDSDLYSNHRYLYERLFQEYQNYTIIDQKKFYIDSSLVSNRSFYIKKSFQYPLLQEELVSVSTLVKLHSLPENSVVGEVEVRLRNQVIGTIKIYEKNQKKKKETFHFWQWVSSLFAR